MVIISWPAVDLLASEERLCAVELVTGYLAKAWEEIENCVCFLRLLWKLAQKWNRNQEIMKQNTKVANEA
jgi:hypothetical protein